MDDRLETARRRYEQAMFGGDLSVLPDADRALDGVEADLALARGMIVHARFLDQRVADPAELTLFERAADLYARLGDQRGEGEALFWVGIYRQVVAGDHEAALPPLRRSYELAGSVDDRLTRSYAVRHLGFADLAAGDPVAARAKLEESVELRRRLGFGPGVAAGLVALAHLAADEGRRPDASALLDEAAAVARACAADGVLRWIDQAREQFGDDS